MSAYPLDAILDPWEKLRAFDYARTQRLDAITNPFVLLMALAREFSSDGDSLVLVPWYWRFIDLATHCTHSEEDMLLHRARDLFRVTITSMREDLVLRAAQREAQAAQN